MKYYYEFLPELGRPMQQKIDQIKAVANEIEELNAKLRSQRANLESKMNAFEEDMKRHWTEDEIQIAKNKLHNESNKI